MTSSLAVTDKVLLGFAAEVGATDPVGVVGGRTRWDVGGEVDSAARLVTAPAGIVNYVPDEMTVTVRAGTTVNELHSELEKNGQRTGR